MAPIFRSVIRGAMLAVVSAGCAGLISGAVMAQGVGMPGVGSPGVGNAANNLPQRQGALAGGGAGGVPGQMNPRVGGASGSPRQGTSMSAPSLGGNRGQAFAGVPRNAAGFTGRAQGGGMRRSADGMVQMGRNAGARGVPGGGQIRRGNR